MADILDLLVGCLHAMVAARGGQPALLRTLRQEAEPASVLQVLDFPWQWAKLRRKDLSVIRQMIRRCLLGLALTALVPVALACSAPPQHECCPDRQPQPCTSSKDSLPTDPRWQSCCVARPDTSGTPPGPLLSQTDSRTPVGSDSGAADHGSTSSGREFSGPVYWSLPKGNGLSASASPRPIYLLTARLRL